jgi:hypothetical protein
MRESTAYRDTQFPANRFVQQDILINNSMRDQDANSKRLRAEASTESVIRARYGLALANYQNLLTGLSEYLDLPAAITQYSSMPNTASGAVSAAQLQAATALTVAANNQQIANAQIAAAKKS